MESRTFSLVALLILLGALAVGAWAYVSNPPISSSNKTANETSTVSSETTVSASTSPNLILDNLPPDQVVRSPLQISGKAKGWYFEAVFPVKIYDAGGNLLGQTQARAQGDWMSGDFVPFSANLTFTPPNLATNGYITLEKDNPSGLSQNADQVTVPVKFR